MARWVDGTAPVGGGAPLSAGTGYADALRAEDRADPLAVGAGSGPLAVAVGWDALAVRAGRDALAVRAGRDALAVSAPSAGRADPLIGYADATLLLGGAGVSPAPPVAEAGASPDTSLPSPQPAAPQPAAPPPAAPRTPKPAPHWARRSAAQASRSAGARAGAGGRAATPPRPPAGSGAGQGGWSPGWSAQPGQGGAGRPGWSAGWTEGAPRPASAPRTAARPGRAGIPPAPGPRRDAISWAELTIRGQASVDRRPAARPAPRASGGSGWDSFFSGAGQPGGRPPWNAGGRPPWSTGGRPGPRSFRELLDLIRRSLRGF